MLSQKNILAKDQLPLNTYLWVPEEKPLAIIQVIHGMAEHAGRYKEMGEFFNSQRIALVAHDLRGHGGTLEDGSVQGYLGDKGGWQHLIDDTLAVLLFIREKYPQTPVVLLGHSMGSLVAANTVELRETYYAGMILSAFPADPGFLGTVGIGLAKFLKLFTDNKSPAKLHDKLNFGSYNKPFEPARTAFDWLSRDHKEVDKYIADPFCGEVFPIQFYEDLLGGVKSTHKNIKKIPIDMPVLGLAGANDPVIKFEHGFLKSIQPILKHIDTLRYHVYHEARHELFHEINKQEVFEDILQWVQETILDH